TCRLAVVGDKGAGKTSLIYRFSRDRLPSADERLLSVLDTDDMDISRDGSQIRLVVHDTSGDDDYAKVRALLYNQVDGIILCFSLDSPKSLARLQLDWSPELRHLCHETPFVLVGTKKDLRDKAKLRASVCERVFVTKKQGKQLAKHISANAYLECSALDSESKGKDVKRVFGRAMRESMKRR
ncbi:unnamed protein product, partial [Candidula unifasciata]